MYSNVDKTYMSAAEKLQQKIDYAYITSKLDELPTLPSIVAEINSLINDPMSTVKDIEELMLQDQSLTTKVLKLINSAYYSIPGGIDDLGRAIGYLGYDAIYQLVLATSVFQSLKIEDDAGFDINKFWQHSIGVAITAEAVANFVQYKNPQELFTAGLIHDIGKIALLKVEPDLLMELSIYSRKNDLTIAEAEEKLEFYKHAKIGFMLAEKWKIPNTLCAVIQHHHTVQYDLRFGVSPELNQAIDIVMFSNLFLHGLQFGDSGYDKKPSIPPELFQRLSITKENIPKIVSVLKKGLQVADRFLEIIAS